MITDVIILAGGFGERLWPASSPSFPKQFMALADGRSFLQNSVLRSLALTVSGKILVVTRKDIAAECARQCTALVSGVPESQGVKIRNDVYVIAEPTPRHTAAAIMTGCLFLQKTSPAVKHTVLVLTSDHVIGPVESFVSDSEKAAAAAEAGNLVCYAIPPTEPSTGYGYIKSGEPLAGSAGASVFKIAQFKEKPDAETAKEYVSSGNYSWNSGMFAFTADFFINEMTCCTPEITAAFKSAVEGKVPRTASFNGVHTVVKWPELEDAYSVTPPVAVDTALAEKTAHAAAVRATFNWTDVGSWDVFSSLFDSAAGTSGAPKARFIESSNSFVYSDLPVALCGVDDVVVVVKNGKVLVLKKGKSQLVRQAVKEMTE